jgi:hypothetical protein
VSLAYPPSPSGRLIHFLDLVLLIWVAAWIVVGLQVRHEVRGLTELSDTVEAAGNSLDQAGHQLDTLKGLPFVGDRIRAVGQQLSLAAASAVESGRSSRGHIESLSRLLGVAIAAAPTLPLVALYVPLRRARIREVRAVRRAMRGASPDLVFDQFLARRASERLPYDALLRVSPHPWEDLSSGRYQSLADAELRRLGIRRRKAKGSAEPSVPSRA